MSLPFLQVDAFASESLLGNPAAVVLQSSWPDAGWMQRVAAELDLSATAFVVPQEDGFGLRWFTRQAEIALCGHGTLAAAWALWSERWSEETIHFHSGSGSLRCWRRDGWIEMDFPSTPPVAAAVDGLAALGVEPQWVGRSPYDVLVEVTDEATLRRVEPDLAALQRIEARGVILTAPAAAEARYHFVSRFFAPRLGLAEDPVTGSAHCCLAPFWAERLRRPELVGYQASRRGGLVRVRLEGDRVVLGGHARPVVRGELLLDPPAGAAGG